jgi:pilus assembly protein TadC
MNPVPIALVSTMLTVFGALSPNTMLSAGFAGLAVFLLLRNPAGQLRRMTRRNSRPAQAVVPLKRLIEGRTDAPPLLRRVLMSVACALALGLAGSGVDGRLGGLVWFVVPFVAAIGVLVLGWVEPQSARRRRRQLIMEVPQALELMAACLGAGVPARTACAAVVQTFHGPVADDLGQVMALLQLGVADVAAWRTLHDHPQLGMAATDLARSMESGTSVVEGLRHHAAAARETRRSELQVRARAVGVRSVLPLMTCFLPSFMLLGIVPAVVSAVFHALP